VSSDDKIYPERKRNIIMALKKSRVVLVRCREM